MTDRVPIRRLATGVPGLDAVLGGGVPEFSFNVIAGTPGAGKTTMVQQIMFALARPDRPALYFTVLGEPPLKMLRYQQQFEFFDVAKVNGSVRFINLAKEVLDGGLDQVLKRIIQEVEATSPAVVIVDSFRSVIQETMCKSLLAALVDVGFLSRLRDGAFIRTTSSTWPSDLRSDSAKGFTVCRNKQLPKAATS
jgi:circadian clock protein KaiC